MHEVLVNRLGGLSLPRKSVTRSTDRPEMTLDVYRGRKTTMQQQQISLLIPTNFCNYKPTMKDTHLIMTIYLPYCKFYRIVNFKHEQGVNLSLGSYHDRNKISKTYTRLSKALSSI